MATAVQHFLSRSKSVCSQHATGCCYRFLLEPGHANMCGVKDTQEAAAYFIRRPPRRDRCVRKKHKQCRFVARLAFLSLHSTLKENIYILKFARIHFSLMVNLFFSFNSSQSFV